MTTREEYVAPNCFILSFQVEEPVNKTSAGALELGVGEDVIEEGGDDE